MPRFHFPGVSNANTVNVEESIWDAIKSTGSDAKRVSFNEQSHSVRE